MKKILYFFAISLILSLVNGCQKPNDEPKLQLFPLIKVSADPATIEYGSSSVINITTTNTDSIVSDLPGLTGVSGSFPTPKLTKTTTYHFTAHGENSLVDTANITIIVKELPPAPTVAISANPYTVIRGKTTTLAWNVTGEVDSVKSNLFPGVFPKFGSFSFTPLENRTITMTAYGKGGITSDTATITVIDPPPPTNEELLCLAPWRKTKWEIQNYPLTGAWDTIAIWPCLTDDTFTFYLYPSKYYVSDAGAALCDGETVRILTGSWSLTGLILIPGSVHIELLTKDILVWTYDGIRILPDGVSTAPTKIRETFKHPTSKK